MSTTARDRRRAIAFVSLSLLLLVAVLALLGGVRLARQDRTYYVAVPDSVSGLRAASTVEYKGVPVGVVREITFRQGSVEAVEVVLAIRQGVPIKLDTRARLRPQGITGLNILELVGGTSQSPALAPGGDIPIEPSLMGELEDVVHDVATLARRLSAATAAVETDALAAVVDLRQTLVAARDAARTLDANTAVIGSEVAQSGAAFRATAEDLQSLLRDPAWKSAGSEVLAALEDARHAIATIDRVGTRAEQLAAENQGDVRVAIENLRRASADVRIAARRVRESPASLIVEHPSAEKAIPDPEPLPAREKGAP